VREIRREICENTRSRRVKYYYIVEKRKLYDVETCVQEKFTIDERSAGNVVVVIQSIHVFCYGGDERSCGG